MLFPLLAVVPLVWPTQFVGPDAACFATSESVEAPAPVVAVREPEAEEPVAESEPPRRPVAVAVWGEIALVTLPADDAS